MGLLLCLQQGWAGGLQLLLPFRPIQRIGKGFIQSEIVAFRLGADAEQRLLQAVCFLAGLFLFFLQAPAVLLDAIQTVLDVAALLGENGIAAGVFLRWGCFAFRILFALLNGFLLLADSAQQSLEILEIGIHFANPFLPFL